MLPQLRLAILGGGLLIGVHLLSEYGAFAMIRFSTFTTAIFEQFQATFDGAAGATLAAVLVLLCLLLLVTEAAARGNARFARIGSGRPARRHADAPGPHHVAGHRRAAGTGRAGVGCAAVDADALALDRRHAGVGCDGNRYRAGPEAGRRRRAAVLTTVLAFPVRLGRRPLRRSAGPLDRGRQLHHQLDARHRHRARPGHRRDPVRSPLYQTAALVICAYVLLFLPRALVSLRSGLAQVPPSVEEALPLARCVAGAHVRACHPPADRPGRRGRRLAGIRRGGNGIDGDAATGAHRHPHPGDEVLVAE